MYGRSYCQRTIAGILVLPLLYAARGEAKVNLEFRPASQLAVVNGTVEIGIYAVSNGVNDFCPAGGPDDGLQCIEALEAIVIWTPSFLRFLGNVDPCESALGCAACSTNADCDAQGAIGVPCSGGFCAICSANQYNWSISGYPSDCIADGINAPCPGGPTTNNDGNAWYQAFPQLQCSTVGGGGVDAPPAKATVSGLYVTTLRFQALAEGTGTLNFLAIWPGGSTKTRVLGGNTPGTDVTGTLGGQVTVTITACPSPTVAVEGCRYIAVTPAAGTGNVALRVRGNAADPPVSCVNAYVQANGRVATTPVFQSVATWGTIRVKDTETLPSRLYSIQADCNPSTPGVNFSAAVNGTTWSGGDTNNDARIDFVDIVRMVDYFQGTNHATVKIGNVDVWPCAPDNTLDFLDILKAVDWFQGLPMGCVYPCP